MKKLLFLAAVVLVGCSPNQLHYHTMIDPPKVKKAQSSRVAVLVNDARSEGRAIGRFHNDYGTVSIRVETDIAALVKGAIEQELTNRGFSLGVLENANHVVEVDLRRFFAEYYMASARGEVVMNVKTYNAALKELLFQTNVVGEGEPYTVWVLPDQPSIFTVESALQNAIAKLMNDYRFIQSLLEE